MVGHSGAGDARWKPGGDRGSPRAKNDTFAHGMYSAPVDFEMADRMGSVAAKLRIARAQVALARLLGKPGIPSPILGTARVQHPGEVATVEVVLTNDDVTYLEEPYRPKGVRGFS